jgi:hypothetical protein
VPDRSIQIFAALPRAVEMSREEFVAHSRQLFQGRSLPQDLPAMISGFRRVPAGAPKTGAILRD